MCVCVCVCVCVRCVCVREWCVCVCSPTLTPIFFTRKKPYKYFLFSVNISTICSSANYLIKTLFSRNQINDLEPCSLKSATVLCGLVIKRRRPQQKLLWKSKQIHDLPFRWKYRSVDILLPHSSLNLPLTFTRNVHLCASAELVLMRPADG